MAATGNKNESFSTGSSPDNEMANKGKGSQGVDKAPGEETAQENVQVTHETQKGKKVDRDITDEDDKPLDKQDI